MEQIEHINIDEAVKHLIGKVRELIDGHNNMEKKITIIEGRLNEPKK